MAENNVLFSIASTSVFNNTAYFNCNAFAVSIAVLSCAAGSNFVLVEGIAKAALEETVSMVCTEVASPACISIASKNLGAGLEAMVLAFLSFFCAAAGMVAARENNKENAVVICLTMIAGFIVFIRGNGE